MYLHFRLLLTLLLALSFSGCTWQPFKDSFSTYAWRRHDYDTAMSGTKVTKFDLSFEQVQVDHKNEFYPYLGQAVRSTVYQAEIRDYFIQELRSSGILSQDTGDQTELRCRMISVSGEALEDWKPYASIPLYLVLYFRDYPWLRVNLRMRCALSGGRNLSKEGMGLVYARPFSDLHYEVRRAYERAVDNLVYRIISELVAPSREAGPDD